ncbi:MAG: DUF502 domain-containing protein, partial [Planctomycetota bacterium]|nr:DUF502 domain-containing protein [Planctomycetota bacterium]
IKVQYFTKASGTVDNVNKIAAATTSTSIKSPYGDQETSIESYKVNPSYFEKEKDGSLKYGKELREDISRKLPWWPGFVLVVAAIFAAGIFLASFLGRRLWWLGEGVIKRVPIVKEVYSSAKQVTDFIFGGSKEGREYSRVVAVEYPMSGVWCVGFQTGWGLAPLKEREGKVVVSVFIPCSPVPMSGFTVIVPEEKVVHLQMSFDEAIQYVVSCGVVTPQLLTTEEGMASEKHLETGVRVSSLPSKEEKTKKGEKGKEQ